MATPISQPSYYTPPSHPEMTTGKSEVPYDNLQALGFHVIGMPSGIPFLSPYLYNEHQLQLIIANLDKIAFLRVDQTDRVGQRVGHRVGLPSLK